MGALAAPPLEEAAPRLGARNLGFPASSTSRLPITMVQSTTTPSSAAPFFTDSQSFTRSVATWIGILAAISIVALFILYRCMRARQNTGHATWRAMLLPKKGIDVKIPYGPHIKVAPPPCLPTPSPSPATTNSPRRPRVPRGRSSRRAARGPDIGEGGRRITSSGPDLEDGGSIYDYDELPAYGGDHRPPAYAGVWSQTTGATPPTNDMLDAQQYEMRTRGATRMRTDSAVSVVEPTRPEAARVARGSVFPELRHHHHRDSVASVASTSADTIRASPSLDKDDLLASPKNKTFKRDEAR